MLKLIPSLIPGSGIALSIVGGLLKPLLAPVVDNSPRYTRVFKDSETGLEYAITDSLEIRLVMWVKDPCLLTLGGMTPPSASASTMQRIRRELVLHTEPLTGNPGVEDHRADRKGLAGYAGSEQPYGQNGNGDSNGNGNGNSNGKPTRSAVGRVLVHT